MTEGQTRQLEDLAAAINQGLVGDDEVTDLLDEIGATEEDLDRYV